MNRIPYSLWISWTVEERAQVAQYYATLGQKWYVDIDLAHDFPPKNSRISDFEEYTGESDDRNIDHRGFSPPDKMQLGTKR